MSSVAGPHPVSLLKCNVIALLLICLLSATAHAGDASLAGDTYVSSRQAQRNFGTAANVNVSQNDTALLLFDLSPLPSGVTPSQIVKANLRIYVNNVVTAGAIDVVPVLSSWDERNVTFASAPALGATGATFAVSQSHSFSNIDITSFVRSWVSDPNLNRGIALIPSATAMQTSIIVDSKENTLTSHPAELEIILSLSIGAKPLLFMSNHGLGFPSFLNLTSFLNNGDCCGSTAGDTPSRIQIPVPCTMDLLQVVRTVAPGPGNSDNFSLRQNGTDSTVLACSIADQNTTCSASGSVSISANDFLSIHETVAGNPTVTSGTITLKCSFQ